MTEPDVDSGRPFEWMISVRPGAIDDLKWFDETTRKLILKLAGERLADNPLHENRNLKTLRPWRIEN